MIVETNPALQDAEFLLKMDNYPIREQLCKVVVLNFNESPLHEITGSIVSGSLTIDGSSACRRTVSLNMITEDPNVNELDWELHTKYVLYIGLKNFVDSKYDDIIWFPQGIFVVTSLSITNNTQGISISLSGKDKMCLLDGSVGGAIFADHDFGQIEITQADGTVEYEDIPIWRVIREAIHTYAHEPYENIVINDLEDVSVELLDYKVENIGAFIYDVSKTSDFSVYDSDMAFDNDVIGAYFLAQNYTDADDQTTIFPRDGSSRDGYYYRVQKHVTYGDTAGYRRTELTYPGEFVINAGGSITSMLDKITSLLGEYEYFYDVYGLFIFRRKKIYHNVVWNGTAEEDVGYFSSDSTSTICYDLSNGQNVESYANKPNLLNIRNDWVIWGQIGGGDKNQYPCHLRYAIDDKPEIYHCLNDGIWYRISNTVTIDDDELNLAQKDYAALEDDFVLGYYPYTPATSAITTYVYNKTFGSHTKKVDWRELLYRMAKDYSLAQAAVEVLSSARDNTDLLQIVDKERLLTKYPNPTNTTAASEALGNYLCGNTVPTNSYYTKPDGTSYYGFWIWDTSAKKFRRIAEADLEKVNEKRLENKQCLLTWQDWVCQSNKLIFFSLGSEDAEFDLGSVSRTIAVRNVYNLWPVKGLGLLDSTSNRVGFANRNNAFMREIQMWEDRLTSRYEIYFADLLAFWPIMYRTINDLDEDSDLSNTRTKALTDAQSSRVRLAAIDFTAGKANYVNSYDSIYKRTDITDTEKRARIRSAANTYWQILINQYATIFGSEEAANLKMSDNIVVAAIPLNNSDQTAIIPQGHDGINTYDNTILINWKNYMGNYIKTQLANIRPDNTNLSNFVDPHISNGVIALYDNYISQTKNIQAQFEAAQATKKRTLLAEVYREWVDNGYWDPDIISYNMTTGVIKFLAPENMLFWFDFLDATTATINANTASNSDGTKSNASELSKYKISVIGHRSKVINDNNIKAIFFRDTPTMLFIGPTEDAPADENLSYTRLNLTEGLEQYFQISTQGKSARDELDTVLYETTYYQDGITVNCLPIYYLEPNQRIRAVDNESGIRGDYIIKSMNISLSYDGMMSIQANKAADRLI